MDKIADTKWDDEEIVFTDMSPDTKFVFDRMTDATIEAVDAREGEDIVDLACGRAIDALKLTVHGSNVYGLEPSPIMIEKALEFPKTPAKNPVILARGIAEYLPYADQSFDKLVCKGAMDHFVDLDKTFSEIARVLRSDGRLIVSVANFSSISCKMGKFIDSMRGKRKGKPFYEPPDDHNFVFDLPFLANSLRPHFEIVKIYGVSLLWGLPGWGKLLSLLPERQAGFILNMLDRLSRIWVSASDVIVAVAKPKKQL